jgi:hypothetical protein
LAFYLRSLSHEFIHIASQEKFGADFSFLHPEDYAFRELMEEAFARSLVSVKTSTSSSA